MLKSNYECVYNRIKKRDMFKGSHTHIRMTYISFKLKWHSVYNYNEAIINKKICQR